MSSSSTKKKCPLCSKLSFHLKALFCRYIGRGPFCRGVIQRAEDKKKQRVYKVGLASPDCGCEKFRVSPHSNAPVGDDEVLARFAFHPIHIMKDGVFKPSVFSQVPADGCSVQRDSKASSAELVQFVRACLDRDASQVWLGLLSATCKAVRELLNEGEGQASRAVCVYDTGLSHNPSHAELFQALPMEKADELELRKKVWEVFGAGVPVLPNQFRGGDVWNELPQQLRERKVTS